jgi:hypothetical protein
MLTKIDLCSRALLKIGEKPIASFEDDTAAAKIAKSLYDAAIDAMLSGYNWRFATKKYRLGKTQSGTFALPADVLRVVGCDRRDYQIAGRAITADADEIEITAIARIGPESFPPYFAAAAATKMAMEFCIPLTGNQNTLALLNALHENEMRAAKFIDSASAAIRPIDDFSLLSARY